MTHLITGSAGFLGSHLAEHLLGNNNTDRVVSMGLRAPQNRRIQHFECDLLDRAKVRGIIVKEKPDRVYHFAGSARVSADIGMPQYHQSNLVTTQSLLEALSAENRAVRLFFASSVHVYGNQNVEVDETSEPLPNGSYGMSKYLAERAIAQAIGPKSNLTSVVGRLYSCIGPGQSEGFVIPDLTRKLVQLPEGGTLETGPLEPFRRFLDVRDAASIIARLVEIEPASRFEIVNIASPFEKQIREMVEMLLAASGKKVPVKARPSDSNPFQGLRLSIDKLQTLIPGLKFRPLEGTLKDMWEWGTLQFQA